MLLSPGNLPFCHLGDGHHLTGFPPLFLFLPPPELFGEPTDDDDEAPNCLRGALAPTAVCANYIMCKLHNVQLLEQ